MKSSMKRRPVLIGVIVLTVLLGIGVVWWVWLRDTSQNDTILVKDSEVFTLEKGQTINLRGDWFSRDLEYVHVTVDSFEKEKKVIFALKWKRIDVDKIWEEKIWDGNCEHTFGTCVDLIETDHSSYVKARFRGDIGQIYN